jgi:hypothetical protein
VPCVAAFDLDRLRYVKRKVGKAAPVSTSAHTSHHGTFHSSSCILFFDVLKKTARRSILSVIEERSSAPVF